MIDTFHTDINIVACQRAGVSSKLPSGQDDSPELPDFGLPKLGIAAVRLGQTHFKDTNYT